MGKIVNYERYFYDHDLITAILDECPVLYLGLQDKDNPYIVPVNYGYAATEDKLLIFFHSGKTGYKLKLIEKNPVCCCSWAMWDNFPDKEFNGHIHDFRSVMAFGKIRKIDFKTETKQCREAMRSLFKKNDRHGCKDPGGVSSVYMFVVECDWADVSAKSETPVRKPEDVPFVDVYTADPESVNWDDADMKETRDREPHNVRYCAYINED